jgi:hypothetical protein
VEGLRHEQRWTAAEGGHSFEAVLAHAKTAVQEKEAEKWVKEVHSTLKRKSLFIALLLAGLAMMAVGYAMEQYYRANVADKNGDGVKDWRDVDINEDGKIDILDIFLIARDVGQPTTAENWKCDINEDGFIDKTDCELASQFYGMSLSVVNLYTNQGKVFVMGVVVAALSLVGIVASRVER